MTQNSIFNGENIATNCSRVTVLALDGLTQKHFGHYALLKINFPPDHQVRPRANQARILRCKHE